jgi:alginate O-acetyltransferase complex protein AlgI
MSFVFYAWGEPVWISLLIFFATIDYVYGLLLEKYRGTVWEKLPLISSLVLNLSLLGVFKYASFLVDNLNTITGLSLNVSTFSLPIGISFYTFQTISYVIDVYRGKIKAQESFLKFMMFVSLYHQLVAGPIVCAMPILQKKLTIAN